MRALRRQIQILFVLSRRRFETIGNLAHEFEVSCRTIRRDIAFLSSENFPIYTVQGNGGGVYVMDHWTFGGFFTKEDEFFLNELLPNIPEDKKLHFLAILQTYSLPNSKKAVLKNEQKN